MKAHRQFKVISKDSDISEGTILSEIPHFMLSSTTSSTLAVLQKTNPSHKYVVCKYNQRQVIFKMGRDIIPYSVGIGGKQKC